MSSLYGVSFQYFAEKEMNFVVPIAIWKIFLKTKMDFLKELLDHFWTKIKKNKWKIFFIILFFVGYLTKKKYKKTERKYKGESNI